jgi:hypothetical protein
MKIHNDNNIKIVHIRFNINDTIDNIKYNKKILDSEIITIKNGKLFIEQTQIRSLKDIIKIFKKNNLSSRNVFIYSGHSDGLFLIHRKIHLLSLKDYMYIIKNVLGNNKADLIYGDACLMGNIGALYIVKKYTKYFIGSPSYYDYQSVLSMEHLYKFPDEGYNRLVNYGKSIIDEYIYKLEKSFKYKSFVLNLALYEMNEDLQEFINIVKVYRKDFPYNKCAINKVDYYYVDIACAFQKMKYNDMDFINRKMNNFIKYHRYHDVGNNLISKLMIILKNPTLYKYKRIEDEEQIFFKEK